LRVRVAQPVDARERALERGAIAVVVEVVAADLGGTRVRLGVGVIAVVSRRAGERPVSIPIRVEALVADLVAVVVDRVAGLRGARMDGLLGVVAVPGLTREPIGCDAGDLLGTADRTVP